MKIIGKNSLIYWVKFPYFVYVVGFILSSLWIITLATYYIFTGNTNSFILKNFVGRLKHEGAHIVERKVEVINFKYPVSSMVLQTDNSDLSIIMSIVGLLSVCFILWGIYYFINNLSQDSIFTVKTLKSLKILGIGIIILGIVHLIVEFLKDGNQNNIGFPLLTVLIGLIILFIKEIFAKGKIIQDENDLTV